MNSSIHQTFYQRQTRDFLAFLLERNPLNDASYSDVDLYSYSASRANLGFIVFAQIQTAKKKYLLGSQVPKLAHKFIGKASEVKIFEQL